MQTQAPPTPPQARPEGKCPRCGSPVDQAQPFCVDCGRRIALGWRKPPNWRIPVGLVALVVIAVGAAAGFGITKLTGSDKGPDRITVRADLPAGAPQPDPGQSTTAPAPTPPAAQPAPAAPSQTAAQPGTWPAGKSAYTVILLTTKNQDAARTTAAKATQGGLPAGVLRSDDFQRFEPGLYIVFSGQYDSIDAASAQARNASASGNPGAYARYVQPK
jgi:hypothetical protein